MEIVKVQLARAIWLFDTQELNPRGLSLYPNVFAALSKRYQFAVLPKLEEIQAGGSIYFKQGKFFHEPSNVSIEIDFEVHGDGVIGSSRHSTEASDEFLFDCLNWLSEQLGTAYAQALTKKRVYRDELIVSMSPHMDQVAPKLLRISQALSTISSKSIETTGITFGSDGQPPTLSIERRVNIPFDANRYFSAAGLQTSQHIEVLKIFEQLMTE